MTNDTLAAEAPTNGEWLESLSPCDRKRADVLIQLITELGAEDPIQWIRSEITEDMAQFSRFLVLRRIRSEAIDNFLYHDFPEASLKKTLNPTEIFESADEALERLIVSGCDINDILSITRAAAFQAADAVVNIIDDGFDEAAPEDAPGWALLETNGDELTGRAIVGLSDNLISVLEGDSALHS
jgi:hypothetical protein